MINTISTHNMYNVSSLYSGGAVTPLNRTGSQYNTSSLTGSSSLYGFQNQFKKYSMQSAVEKATDFKSSADKLKSLLSDFSRSTSKLSQTTAVSSNADSLTVSMNQSGTAKASAMKPMEVQVNQVAKAQSNAGSYQSGGMGSVKAGSYKFEVEGAGGNRSYSVNVGVTDDLKSVQQKMADAINKDSNSAVTARVEVDEKNKTSRLVVEGKNTGETANGGSNGFTVRDTANAGGKGLAETMGITEATQRAQNAVYYVNGDRRESTTNNVDLGQGVQATLKAPSPEPVKVTSGKDTNAAVNSAKDFINSFNDLLSKANEGTGNRSNRLSRELQSLTKTNRSALDRAGISVNNDGSLSANDDKLKAASENGSLDNLFNTSGSNRYGFASRLEQKTSDVSRNPLSFTNEAQMNTYYTSTGQSNYSAYANMNAMFASNMSMFL